MEPLIKSIKWMIKLPVPGNLNTFPVTILHSPNHTEKRRDICRYEGVKLDLGFRRVLYEVRQVVTQKLWTFVGWTFILLVHLVW